MENISLQIYRLRKRRDEKIHTSRKVRKEKRDLCHLLGEGENMNEDTKLISFAATNDQYEMLKERAAELVKKGVVEDTEEGLELAVDELKRDDEVNTGKLPSKDTELYTNESKTRGDDDLLY